MIDVIDEESSNSQQTGEEMPLLDTTQDIERPSQFWALAPESEYDADDNSSTISSSQMLKYLVEIENKIGYLDILHEKIKEKCMHTLDNNMVCEYILCK